MTDPEAHADLPRLRHTDLQRLRQSLSLSRWRSEGAGAQPGAAMKTDIIVIPPTGETCAICLSAIENDCVRTPCGHEFHMACLDEYLLARKREQEGDRRTPNARCPLCRGSMRLPVGVEVSAQSGLRIEVTDVPETGGLCHFDRGYTFLSLGDFQRPGMRYIMTSNEDRKTPASESMWILETSVQTTVHLNFRSEEHVTGTGASAWLSLRGWLRNSTLQSTVSTGHPRGTYQGPVFSQTYASGRIELMGSNTWEGVYFVFVEVRELLAQALAPAEAPANAPASAPAETAASASTQEASPQDVRQEGSVQRPGDHVQDSQRAPPRAVRRSADFNPPRRDGWQIQPHVPLAVRRGGGTVQQHANNIQDGRRVQEQPPQVARRGEAFVQRLGDGVQETATPRAASTSCLEASPRANSTSCPSTRRICSTTRESSPRWSASGFWTSCSPRQRLLSTAWRSSPRRSANPGATYTSF